MKKHSSLHALLLTFSLLCSAYSYAQYNQNFDIAALPYDIAQCNNGEYCTASATGFRRFDFSGTLLWERYYTTVPLSISPTASRLVHTEDDGVIFFTTSSNNYNPVAIKIDNGGNLVWSKEYFSNPGPLSSIPLLANFIRVDAKRMQNIADENYILFTTGLPFVRNGEDTTFPYNQRNEINVLRIDQDGNLIWNKKYAEHLSSSYWVQDLSNTISYAGTSNITGNNIYYIAGVREEHPLPTGMENDAMFQMMIDENGNIDNVYQKVPICSYPFNIDALYDKDKNRVVTTFTMGDCGIVGTPTASQIGLITVDQSLNIGLYKYYWLPNTNENFSYRIQKGVVDGNYFISGWTYDKHIFDPFGDFTGAHNVCLLKTDLAGTPIFYRRYMVAEESFNPNNMIVNYNPATNDESYVMSFPSTPHSGGTTFSRLLGTDINGNVCGVWDFSVKENKSTLSYTNKEYDVFDLNGYQDYPLQETTVTPITPDFCRYSHQYGYKPTSVAALNSPNSDVKIYPTLLSANDNQLHLDIKMTQASAVTIIIYTIDGRKMQEKKWDNITAGVLNVSVNNLLPGNYIVSVQSEQKEINTTVQISKM